MRAMALADRHGFPLVTMVDTPGASRGGGGAARPGGAIARSQAAMVRLLRADGGLRHRRGGLGRRRSDSGSRPRAHAGERDLLRHLARGLRGDLLARRGREARPRPRSSRTRRTVSSSASSRRSCPSPRGCAHGSRRRPRLLREDDSTLGRDRRSSIPSNGAGRVVRSTASWVSARLGSPLEGDPDSPHWSTGLSTGSTGLSPRSKVGLSRENANLRAVGEETVALQATIHKAVTRRVPAQAPPGRRPSHSARSRGPGAPHIRRPATRRAAPPLRLPARA